MGLDPEWKGSSTSTEKRGAKLFDSDLDEMFRASEVELRGLLTLVPDHMFGTAAYCNQGVELRAMFG